MAVIIPILSSAQFWRYKLSTPKFFETEYFSNVNVSLGSDQDFYISGEFSKKVDVNIGADTTNLFGSGRTRSSDFFVSRYNSNWELEWYHNYSNPFGTNGLKNIRYESYKSKTYLHGSYRGDSKINPFDSNDSINATYEEAFIQCVTDSSILWQQETKRLSGFSRCYSNSVAVDSNGFTYWIGQFMGTVAFDINGKIIYAQSTGASFDGFIMKLDSIGKVVWFKQIEGTHIVPFGKLDEQDNLVIVGEFSSDSLDLDLGTAKHMVKTYGNNDVFIIKMDNNGSFINGGSLGGYQNDDFRDFEISKDGSIFIAAHFRDTMDSDLGPKRVNIIAGLWSQCYLLKLNTDVELEWFKEIHQSQYQSSIITDFTVDDQSNVFLIGEYVDTISLMIRGDLEKYGSEGGKDIYLQYITSDGDLNDIETLNGFNDDFGNKIVWQNGSIHISGNFENELDFDYRYSSKPITNSAKDGVGFVVEYSCSSYFRKKVYGRAMHLQCGYTKDSIPKIYDLCGNVFEPTNIYKTPIITFGDTTLKWIIPAKSDTLTFFQYVLIQDTIAPKVYETLEPIYFECSINSSALNKPSFNDNCSGLIIGETAENVEFSNDTLISWFFDDGNGNVSISYQQLIRQDKIAPVPNAASLPVFNASCNPDSNNLTIPTAMDFCDGEIKGIANVDLPLSNGYIDTIVWTYTDVVGNEVTQIQLVKWPGLNTKVLNYDPTLIAELKLATDYQWLNCSNNLEAIERETKRSFTPKRIGRYAVEITRNACIDTSDCIVVYKASINENQVISPIELYPSPAHDLLNIEIQIEKAGVIDISVYNLLGKKVKVISQDYLDVGIHKLNVNMADVARGTYLLKVDMEHGVVTKKIIIE
ncbi:MAG: T9SS type A sorting domain-containing protein [Bacteroidia bacterium]